MSGLVGSEYGGGDWMREGRAVGISTKDVLDGFGRNKDQLPPVVRRDKDGGRDCVAVEIVVAVIIVADSDLRDRFERSFAGYKSGTLSTLR